METPYTAAQIASACPVGRKLKLAVEVEGEKPGETVKQFQLLEFKAATPTGATIVATMLDDQGKETGDREESEVSWEELKTHAEFPQARTKRTDGDSRISKTSSSVSPVLHASSTPCKCVQFRTAVRRRATVCASTARAFTLIKRATQWRWRVCHERRARTHVPRSPPAKGRRTGSAPACCRR